MKKHAILKNDGFVYYSKAGLISVKKTIFKYTELVEALFNDEVTDEQLRAMIIKSTSADVEDLSDGKIKKVDDHLEATVDDQILVMPADIHKKVVELMRNGADYSYLEKFWRRCLANPNRGSVEQLYDFITRHLLTITEDGHFIAYKGVLPNFWDKYTGCTHLNTVGSVIEMPREGVTFDPNEGCSAGLHVANLGYAKSYAGGSGIVIAVKVDPADVVSVAYECTYQKIRVCRYEVIRVWEDENSCKSPVVDDNMNSVVPPAKNIRTGELTDSEFRAVNALAIPIKSGVCRNAATEMSCLASKLQRSVADIAAHIQLLTHPVVSYSFTDAQLHTIAELVMELGHSWTEIYNKLRDKHPEAADSCFSVDAVRKVAKRMGL